MDMLVSARWLADALTKDDVVVLDASYHLAAAGRDAAAEFSAGHIPGAQFLDLATLVDPASAFDNTVPTPAQFEQRVRSLGISNDTRIVLYDNSPLHSAARGWFLFTLFGARHVFVLDGGLAKWQAEGRAESRDIASPAPGRFTAVTDPDLLRTKAQMIANVGKGAEQVIDARSAARFTGVDPEPRAGMASGHIPAARNLPIGMLYEADGTMKTHAAIEAEFIGAGVDPARPVVTSCGSGITAAVLNLALARIGKKAALYDGSWAEWGADPGTPKETGPARARAIG